MFIGRQTASVYRIDAAKLSHTSHKKNIMPFQVISNKQKIFTSTKKTIIFSDKRNKCKNNITIFLMSRRHWHLSLVGLLVNSCFSSNYSSHTHSKKLNESIQLLRAKFNPDLKNNVSPISQSKLLRTSQKLQITKKIKFAVNLFSYQKQLIHWGLNQTKNKTLRYFFSQCNQGETLIFFLKLNLKISKLTNPMKRFNFY